MLWRRWAGRIVLDCVVLTGKYSAVLWCQVRQAHNFLIRLLIQVGVRAKFDGQKYLEDLKKAVQLAKTHPEEIHGLAKIYKDAALAPAPVVEGILAGYADALYQ